MTSVPGARRSFRFPWRTRAQVASDVQEELEFHLERVAEELAAAGWPPEAARLEARRRFGDVDGTVRYCATLGASKEKRMRWMETLGELGQDLRFAGRQLAKSPVFTLVAVLTLALGIGATTSIFSVVYGVVLNPLPYPEPDRLIRPYFIDDEGERHGSFSVANFLDWKAGSRTIKDASAISGGTFNLTGDGGEPERLPGASVSASHFSVLGVRPLAGRAFAPGEDKEGAPRVAVISEELWRRRFGGSPEMVGRSLTLNGDPHTVVGIIPRGLQLPSSADVWVPLVFPEDMISQRGAVYLSVIARLAKGATLEQAEAESDVLGKRLAEQYPDANAGYTGGGMTLQTLQEQVVGDTRKPLLILLGAVGFVLLIACSNVANLLLVRAASREGEMVIRTALGARRVRIVRQLLTESVVLALVGGAAGVALAAWALKALVRLAPLGLPRLEEIHLDGTALLFALAISVLTGLLFGLAPALQTSRTDLAAVLREGTRGSKGRGGTRARSVLVVVEMALAVVLLAGAGLLIQSFARIQEISPGFDSKDVVTFNLELPTSQYPDEARVRAFASDLLERMEQIPGVDAAGATSYGMPFAGSGNFSLSFSVAGRPPAPPGKEDSMAIGIVTPDYFKTLSIPVVRGRSFTPQDRNGAQQVVVINESAVRRFFPGEDPLGQRIDLGWSSDGVTRGGEVVGIVADFKQDSLEREVEPQLFLSYDQAPLESLAVVVRSNRDPATVGAEAKARLRELDPNLPVYGLQPMEELLSTSTSQARFYTMLLGSFAAVSLMLAAIGIYGVIAYAVRQRTQEIGIRMALGASGERVMRMVVGQGMVLAGVGALAGLLLAFLATRGMQSLLYEVSASDPATYTGVAVVLVLVAAFASWLPARRAARTDPQMVLRGE